MLYYVSILLKVSLTTAERERKCVFFEGDTFLPCANGESCLVPEGRQLGYDDLCLLEDSKD